MNTANQQVGRSNEVQAPEEIRITQRTITDGQVPVGDIDIRIGIGNAFTKRVQEFKSNELHHHATQPNDQEFPVFRSFDKAEKRKVSCTGHKEY